jgi:tetratricopeptide (TPR) repeat protein
MVYSIRVKIYIFPLLLFALFSNPIVVLAQIDTQAQIDSLHQLFDHSKDFDEKKKLLTALSNLYGGKGSWEKYEEVVKEMLLLQDEKKDLFYLAETYNKLGISNSCMGKNQNALEYFQKALEINLAQNEVLIVANSYENMAAAYKDMGDYSNATDCLLKSLEIRKEKNHPRLFNNYMKLAVLQELLENIPQEDYYMQMARNEMQKRDSISPSNMAIFYNQLGNLYNTRKMYDSCLICYKIVIDYSEQIGWNRGIAEGLGNLADVFTKTGSLDSSIIYHKKSLQLSEEIDDCIGSSQEYLYLAEIYHKVNKNDSVMFFAREALRKAKDCNLLREQGAALNFISDYYNEQHNFEKAYEFLQRYYQIKDSISSVEVRSNIAELGTKYKTKAKEQQIELLTAENEIKNQRIGLAWLFIGFLLSLVILVLALFYFRRKQAAFKQSELQQQLLRSQMNPHFIFNVMGSIQSFLYKNEAKMAADYLSRFASLSRSVLEFSSQESITLKEEIEMLQNYIELQKAGLENPFNVEYIIDEEMETEFIQIPPMLLQPFVENAIKHGLKNINYQGNLCLCFKEEKDFIAVEILDNGTGITLNSDNNHKSRAMEIFQQRKKGIEHKYKKEITFEFQNLNTIDFTRQGVRVYFQLPILNND